MATNSPTATALATLKDFLPTAHAADALKISGTMVRRLCDEGKLPGAVQPWGPAFGWLIPTKVVAARKLAKKRGLLPIGGRPKVVKPTGART